MKKKLPKSILNALDRGISYFMGEEHQWKLKIEERNKYIEKLTGIPVLVFANNGYGDYLFLKENKIGDAYEQAIYEYFHEGPEIKRIHDELDTLLGLVNRPPSNDDYPIAKYELGEFVQIGDHVQIKIWMQFWKGWQDGIVSYVPSISIINLEFEYNGLKWICITFGEESQFSTLVSPDTGIIKKVRLVKRSKRQQ